MKTSTVVILGVVGLALVGGVAFYIHGRNVAAAKAAAAAAASKGGGGGASSVVSSLVPVAIQGIKSYFENRDG